MAQIVFESGITRIAGTACCLFLIVGLLLRSQSSCVTQRQRAAQAMTAEPLRIVYLTAGAAGMYCGSCLHDNTLARAMAKLGVEIQLIPTYTPIRTDEEDVTADQVFFGGISVYLQQRIPFFRHLPSIASRFLSHPSLIRWVASHGRDADPQFLGEMAVSMLKGRTGFQRTEVIRLCEWIAGSARPQLVNFSNVLIAGCIPELRRKLDVPIVVTLQGDDVFLESLPESHRIQAISLITELVEEVDVFLVFSKYYADFMARYLSIPPEKLSIVPLGIDVIDLLNLPRLSAENRATQIGYLARISPEKGLHVLVDAFIELRRCRDDVRLLVAGWLGGNNHSYLESQLVKLRQAGLEKDFEYRGEVNREEKRKFLSEIDVLSVPTVYRDPKGLFVLEALAAGVPVVQPDHGAFPEIIRDVGGGELVRPDDPLHLAEVLKTLLANRPRLESLGKIGKIAVCERRNAETMAQATIKVYQRAIQRHSTRGARHTKPAARP